MQDYIGVVRILPQFLDRFGSWQDQQLDVTPPCFLHDFLHHGQPAVRPGSYNQLLALPGYLLFHRQRRAPELVLKPLRWLLLALQDRSTIDNDVMLIGCVINPYGAEGEMTNFISTSAVHKKIYLRRISVA